MRFEGNQEIRVLLCWAQDRVEEANFGEATDANSGNGEKQHV